MLRIAVHLVVLSHVCVSRCSVRRMWNNSWFQTFALFWMLYAFFWVIPRRLNVIYRRFGSFYVHITVHRNRFLFKYPTRRTNYPNLFCYKTLTCFGHLLCPSSGVFYCIIGTGKFHSGFWWPFPSRVRMELHVSGNLLTLHQEFSTGHSALVSFMQVFDDRF